MATKPLYGDPANAAPVWSKYAVLLGSLTATNPTGNANFILNDPTAGTPITTEWDPVGALTSDTPFDNGTESLSASDHDAAGFGVYSTTYTNMKETVAFTAKETTLTTLGILYDASGLTTTSGNVSGTLKQRDTTEQFKIAFQRTNSTQLERRISKNYAYIDSITRAFSNNESLYTVTVTIVPSSTSELYLYYLGAK